MALARSLGLTHHYVDEGAGDPPFVFVHGWCCDHTFFAPQFDHFKSRSHRVVTYDLRGCGQSDKPDGGYDLTTFADDLAGLCRELGVTRPIVVGHSLGGNIAIELAARHPSLPRAIVAVDPGEIEMLPRTRAVFQALIAALEGPDSQAAREQFIRGMFLATDDPERCRRITRAMCSPPPAIAIAMLRGFIAWNGVGALRLCKVPLLMVRSEPGDSDESGRLMAIKSDIQMGITVGAGHFLQFEVPGQLNAMIERFLETLG